MTFLIKKILIRINCSAAKHILHKDVKKLISKQFFARWQAQNSLPDFLTCEFLQGHETFLYKQKERLSKALIKKPF